MNGSVRGSRRAWTSSVEPLAGDVDGDRFQTEVPAQVDVLDGDG